jgi:hypothetical protein
MSIIIPGKDFTQDPNFRKDFNHSYDELFLTPGMKEQRMYNTYSLRINLQEHIPFKISINDKWYCWYTKKEDFKKLKGATVISWAMFSEMINGQPLDKNQKKMLNKILVNNEMAEITLRTQRPVEHLANG